MSKHVGCGRARYNYYPNRTRPGGVGEVWQPDPKRPEYQPERPGKKRGYDVKRPRR